MPCGSTVARTGSHRFLEFQHELVHRPARRRLDREVARVIRVAPELAVVDQPESGGLDLAAQRALLDAVERLADRGAVARAGRMVGDDQRSARLERGEQLL